MKNITITLEVWNAKTSRLTHAGIVLNNADILSFPVTIPNVAHGYYVIRMKGYNSTGDVLGTMDFGVDHYSYQAEPNIPGLSNDWVPVVTKVPGVLVNTIQTPTIKEDTLKTYDQIQYNFTNPATGKTAVVIVNLTSHGSSNVQIPIADLGAGPIEYSYQLKNSKSNKVSLASPVYKTVPGEIKGNSAKF